MLANTALVVCPAGHGAAVHPERLTPSCARLIAAAPHCLILLALVLQAMVRQCMSYIPDTPDKVGD